MKLTRKQWRDWTSDLIKKGAVDSLLLLLSKGWSFINVGPVNWVAEKIIEYVWDKTGDKLIRMILRKGWLAYDLHQGRFKIKKINKAKENEDSNDYWDTISDI